MDSFETVRPMMPPIPASRAHLQKGATHSYTGTEPISVCTSARRQSVIARPRLSVVQTAGSENAPYEKMQLPVPRSSVLGDATNTYSTGHRQLGCSDVSGLIKPNVTDQGITTQSTDADMSGLGEWDVDFAAAKQRNPQQVGEYMHDIFNVMKRDESLNSAPVAHMEKQLHVNAKMRAILVDWLVDVHKKYKMRPESLFLAVQLLDRYLDKEVIVRRQLQLVGITALMISAKFEEIYPPQMKEFVHVCDKTYSKEDITKMEVLLLQAMHFQVCCPTAMHFLDQYLSANGCSDSQKDLAQYLVELSLVDHKMLKYAPSHQAAAAVLLSNKLLRKPSWTPAVATVTKMTESMLKECAREMCCLLENAETSSLQAVRRKFSHSRYNAVSQCNYMVGPGCQVASIPAERTVRRSRCEPATSMGAHARA